MLPSQRQGLKTALYDVWVCLNTAHGWILTGNCTCMAGLGSSCSHVAALLFKLEAAAHFKLNDKTTCMSQFCSLKASRKYVEPAPLSAIDFSRSKKHALPKASKKVITYVSYSCVGATVVVHGLRTFFATTWWE